MLRRCANAELCFSLCAIRELRCLPRLVLVFVEKVGDTYHLGALFRRYFQSARTVYKAVKIFIEFVSSIALRGNQVDKNIHRQTIIKDSLT